MAEARRGIGLLRAMLLALAIGSGGGMLPLRALQPMGTAVAQDEDEEYADESDDVDGGDEAEEDSGEEDSGEEDSGEEDSGEEDSGEEDSGEEDSGEEDSGEEDSGEEDSGEEDSGEEDSGEEDSGEEDSGEEDSGEEDWSDDEFAEELDAEEGNDFGDDDWAGEYEESDDAAEADDAIPVDEETWGEDVEWEVSEVVEVFDYGGGADAGADEDSVGVGGMLVLNKGTRTKRGSGAVRGASNRGAAQGGRTPARPPAAPGRPRSKDDDEDVPYAYGGRPVSALSVPWQAQIFKPGVVPDALIPTPTWQRSHICGGALIARDWVLTAAHCVTPRLLREGLKVRLGVSDISRGDGITYRIEQVVRHSQYNPDSRDLSRPPNMYGNDIALIRIAEDGAPKRRDPARIREIPLNRRPLAGGAPVSATGWGAVGTGDAQVASAAILRVDLRLMDTPVCQQRPGYGPQKIHGRVFCAAHPTRSTCAGDSGGPVVLTNGKPVLVGLVSWGKRKCAGDGRPGVYTRVDQYLAWIDQAMKLPPGRNALP